MLLERMTTSTKAHGTVCDSGDISAAIVASFGTDAGIVRAGTIKGHPLNAVANRATEAPRLPATRVTRAR